MRSLIFYHHNITMTSSQQPKLWITPTLHKDAKEYYKVCDICQRVGKPSRRDEIPLELQLNLHAFEKWAIDFVGPINPLGKCTGEIYIIIPQNI
jgi:hypothetical protein